MGLGRGSVSLFAYPNRSLLRTTSPVPASVGRQKKALSKKSAPSAMGVLGNFHVSERTRAPAPDFLLHCFRGKGAGQLDVLEVLPDDRYFSGIRPANRYVCGEGESIFGRFTQAANAVCVGGIFNKGQGSLCVALVAISISLMASRLIFLAEAAILPAAKIPCCWRSRYKAASDYEVSQQKAGGSLPGV